MNGFRRHIYVSFSTGINTVSVDLRGKIIFTLSVFLFLIQSAMSQSIFVLQNPQYSPEQINSITFYGSYGICAGNYGMTLRSTDNGGSWTGLSPFTNSDIGRVHLFDQSRGYMTADSNMLYLTSNGGVNWQPAYGFESRIKDISFINQNTGFAVTDRKFWKTTTSGISWSFLYPLSSNQYRLSGVYFLDQNTGFICTKDPVTTYSLILKTTNGGLSWTRFETYIDEFEATKIKFINSNTGWCAGNRFDKIFVMNTTNGGTTWNESYIPSSAGIPVGTFYSGLTGGFIVTEYKVYRSDDAGFSWSLYRGGLGYTSAYLNNDSMLYISDNTGALYRLNVNSGLSVTVIGVSNTTLNRILAVQKNYVYCSGNNYSFLKTNDGGNNWVQDPNTGFRNFSDYFFTDSLTGYGVNGRGDIWKTYYFGTSWDRIYTSSYEFNSICFANGSTGWAFGNGMLLKTQNAGLNWQVINTPQTFSSPQFFSTQRGYCKGSNNLYFTSDGGSSWQLKGQGIVQYFHFINENTGWATNSFDTVTYIYRTTDGGANLNEISHVNESAAEIKFLNSGTGYICGRSKLYRTTNSGFTWMSARYPVSERIRILSMSLIDDNNGWLCGDNSAIIKFTNGGMIYAGNVSEFVPEGFELYQNYPNPFNSSCKFKIVNFKLSEVELSLYEITGKKVADIFKGRLNTGTHEFLFDASGLSSGIYFYVLKAGRDVILTRKMALIK